MTLHVDYYISLNSPWTHLGVPRFEAMVARNNATVAIYPVDFGTIFAASGGLPLPKRAPQRQAYRMMELKRWQRRTGMPITLEPAHFPSHEALASAGVIALRETEGNAPAIRLAHRVLKGLWEEERDMADPTQLAAMIGDVGMDAGRIMALGADPQWAARKAQDSQDALARGVFGAPSYVVDGEIFWGQDRLDFLAERLAGG